MRLDLFCKQISLTLIIFNRNGDDYREKNEASVENYSTHTHSCKHYILVLFIVLKTLFATCERDWILNPSRFFQYLATILQIQVSNFFPTLLFLNH